MLKLVILSSALTAVLIPRPAASQPILDQVNTFTSSSLNGGSTVYEWQQGVTAGLTGQLTHIEVFVAQFAGTTEVSVYLHAPWNVGPSAWSAMPALSLGWNTIDLTAASIFVVTGQPFTISVHGQGDNIFPPDLGFWYGDQYRGGELLLNGSTAASIGHDLNFRTYVDPTPVSFTGFFPPIDNDPVVNQTKAGAAVPVKFSLRGDQGLNIFAAGFPASQSVACDSFATLAPVEETGKAGQSGLTYDASNDQYIYLWKTEKAWAKTCRQLVIRFTDGSFHIANFKF